MSAFIVADKTINKIIAWFGDLVLSDPYIRRLAQSKYALDIESEGWQQKLAQAFYDMNVEAVNQRYGEKNQCTQFSYTPVFYESRIVAIKSLMCWLHQCHEGNVPDNPVFKYFEEVARHVALLIVMDLPEWEEAEWG
jgi:hypothetical protein